MTTGTVKLTTIMDREKKNEKKKKKKMIKEQTISGSNDIIIMVIIIIIKRCSLTRVKHCAVQTYHDKNHINIHFKLTES